MIQHSDNRTILDRFRDRDGRNRAVQDAVRQALRRHMLLGESVAVADDSGGARIIGPDQIRNALESQKPG